MSSHAQVEHPHAGASVGTNLVVWIGLVAITGLEVFLAYMKLEPVLMLSVLVVLSVVKAGLIMSYFMHLKFERFQLVLWLIPATIFCIFMMLIIFSWDSLRLLQMRPQ
jgi:caa(3)-type oxidase subunit IV